MTNSNLVKDQIRHHYGVSPDKIHVIYNSVDHQQFNISAKDRFRKAIRTQYGIGENDLLIFFVGNGFQLKGLPILLEALANLRSGKIRLMVAGSDPIAPYRQWVEQNGLGDATTFLGYQTALERFYGAADLLVLPTQYDPFANVCLEAMACGTPVITTRMNGVSEIIQDGFDGFILNTRNASELSTRIRDFLTLPDKSIMMTHAAEKAKTFTVEKHMRQLINLYNLVCEGKRK
jgi:UDP-glucose:(heptosyl)LPS alpha-1,3-glucosyltransferase